MKAMSKGEIAKDYFKQGYNCAQAVARAFFEETGKSESELALLMSPFGGGLARMREVCGAVSGGALVLGLLYGFDSPDQTAEKAALYKTVQKFAEKFKAENGAIVCKELLVGGFENAHNPVPAARTDEYYKKRPCAELVEMAADIVEEIIKSGNQ
jgi:C_GCAxxG_C_C family probable redox protein